MNYTNLIKDNAPTTDIRQFLISGETTAITIRIPKTLRDAAKESAELKGMGLSAFIRTCLIEALSEKL